MALRLGALHDALLHPGDAVLAREAAEELAGYDDRLGRIERDTTILKWMVGTMITLQLIALGGIAGVFFRLVTL